MKNIAIFASGNGSNFEALADACNSGFINGKVVLLVCDKKDAYVIERAKKFSVPVFSFTAKDFSSKEEYETLIVNKLKENDVELVCLAGYMRIYGKVLLEGFEGKIINIHPALLPAFKGAHGIKDAYEYGVKVFGVTVHYVDSGMDTGRIIDQEAFHIENGVSLEKVENKIHEIEHVLYPKVVKLMCEGK